MTTIVIPAIAKYGYIIPTKAIDKKFLGRNSKITITIENKDEKKPTKDGRLLTYIKSGKINDPKEKVGPFTSTEELFKHLHNL